MNIDPEFKKIQIRDALQIAENFWTDRLDFPAAIYQINTLLNDFTHPENSLRNFISQLFTLSLGDFSINKLTGEKLLGNSLDDPIYKIVDKNNKILSYVKIFKVYESYFLNELMSFKYYMDAHFKSFKVPEILGVGKCRQAGANLFLMAIRPVGGKSLDRIIEETSDFESILRLISLAGKSLSEIHMSKNGSTEIFLRYTQYQLFKLVNEAQSHLKSDEKNKHLDEEISAITQMIWYDFKLNPPTPCFIHGNSRLFNAFYDDQTDTFSWINLEESYPRSVTVNGEVIGVAALDTLSFLSDIYSFHTHESKILTAAQINKLVNAFKYGYEESGAVLKDNTTFYYFIHDVKRLINDTSRASKLIKKYKV